jgi:hypothetical protein
MLPLGLSPRYVAIFRDRPRQPRAGVVRHGDGYCPAIQNVGNNDICETTDEEMKHLERCGRCA